MQCSLRNEQIELSTAEVYGIDKNALIFVDYYDCNPFFSCATGVYIPPEGLMMTEPFSVEDPDVIKQLYNAKIVAVPIEK